MHMQAGERWGKLAQARHPSSWIWATDGERCGGHGRQGARSGCGTGASGASRWVSCTHGRDRFLEPELWTTQDPKTPPTKAFLLSGRQGCQSPDGEGASISSLGVIQTPGGPGASHRPCRGASTALPRWPHGAPTTLRSGPRLAAKLVLRIWSAQISVACIKGKPNSHGLESRRRTGLYISEPKRQQDNGGRSVPFSESCTPGRELGFYGLAPHPIKAPSLGQTVPGSERLPWELHSLHQDFTFASFVLALRSYPQLCLERCF